VAPSDPWLACRLAASLGGDSDTVAALAGAMLGSCRGEAFPAYVVEALHAANPDLALEALADDLLALRGNAAHPGATNASEGRAP
jgi:ADP-ribosylglycohydrolase